MVERVVEEGFLGRWSRLKRETRAEGPPEELTVETAEAEVSEEAAVEEEAPDLPPLDSLGADSDYTGFLRNNVPAELRREALRKAWVSDPVIAGFRGFADYDWDYNAPGYGALRPTDDIARLLDAILPDEKREEDVVEVVVVEKVQADNATRPGPNPPPLGGGGSECPSGKAEAVPPPPSGGGQVGG
ncbi:DUF3306 domain-containing protein [Azospirillum sp. TSH100]|uniref:DUF3306 domain-containing protein n=1 Tax=Azospirillum sp. TSH100 TaxID=652764 RepID=UPI000D642776|nr:DUF3306 domain-containing protein [Azospirillum sp. TSH100]QCG91467.1 DUF3306 domain-containing protein [Azospirillum sp. TSH100]